MTDNVKNAPAETAMARALRMKKAAMGAKPKPPGAARETPTAGVKAGASKPWKKR